MTDVVIATLITATNIIKVSRTFLALWQDVALTIFCLDWAVVCTHGVVFVDDGLVCRDTVSRVGSSKALLHVPASWPSPWLAYAVRNNP